MNKRVCIVQLTILLQIMQLLPLACRLHLQQLAQKKINNLDQKLYAKWNNWDYWQQIIWSSSTNLLLSKQEDTWRKCITHFKTEQIYSKKGISCRMLVNIDFILKGNINDYYSISNSECLLHCCIHNYISYCICKENNENGKGSM
jgi:hypothetical protein